DPIGVVMILFFGIGFAKGVPVNSLNFRDRKKGIIVTSLAGPLSNVLLAFLCLLAYKLLYISYALVPMGILATLLTVLNFMVSINLSLAVFNMLPIPPLDGWNVLCQFLPSEIYWKVAAHERELVFLVLLLIMIGILDGPIGLLSHLLFVVIDKLTFFADFLRVIIL
ncbi:MAG: site-2 protease family protein, partial [Oscillospiraceae bacterium]